MPLVKIKDKYQVTLPAEVRRTLDLKVGDYLEVEAKDAAIVLKPKAMIDKGKKEAWEALRELLERVHSQVGDAAEEEVERDVLEAIKAVREDRACS